MRKVLFFTLMFLLANTQAVAALESSVDMPHIMIVELQTGSITTGTEEFIELYNPTPQPVDITGWRLQYRAATSAIASAWTAAHTKATVTCVPGAGEATCSEVIAPQGRKLFATYATTEPALTLSGGFALAGGQVRLVRPVGSSFETVDLLGYGTSLTFEGLGAASAPQAGQSLKRLVQNGVFVDSDNNIADFYVDCGQPTPGIQTLPLAPLPSDDCNAQPEPDPPTSEPDDSIDQPQQESEDEAPKVFLPLEITEVFPDPVSPQQDGRDEFVEVYNPNNEAVNIEDYALHMGNTFQYKVALGRLILPPHAYAIVISGDSSLSLSNSGTVVRLLDPNGSIRDESPNFSKAVAGASWSKNPSGWHWSTTVTPTAGNIITEPVVKSAVKKVKADSIQKTIPKTVAAQPLAPAQSVKDEPVQTSNVTTATTTQSPNYWVLAIVGVGALAYAVFEYRQDIAHYITKMRSRLGRPKQDSEIS